MVILYTLVLYRSTHNLMAPPTSGPTFEPHHSLSSFSADREDYNRHSPSDFVTILSNSSRGDATIFGEASGEDP